MAYTLNNIVSMIDTFVSQHDDLRSFYFGRLPDSTSERDIEYPTVLAELQPSPIEEKSERFVFTFYVLDLASHDRSNERDSLSDCKLYANDIVAYFRQTGFSHNLSIETNITMTPLIGALDDLCNGWEFTLTFKQFLDLDVCQIPLTIPN